MSENSVIQLSSDLTPEQQDENLQAAALAYSRAANDKAREAIKVGLQGRAFAALDSGDMEQAAYWAKLAKEVIEAAEGVSDDYAAAARIATFRKVLSDLEDNASDRARSLVDSGTVGPEDRLMARLAGISLVGGVKAQRTAKSDDGAKRAGSDEDKGSVKEALIGYLSTQGVGVWSSITQVGKWITQHGTEYGYSPSYVCDGGRITARNAQNPTAAAWRADNHIEFAQVNLGGPSIQWAVRRTA